MSDTISALERDHANMAKLLDLIESELLAVEVGKSPDYPLLQDIMRYMAHYPDRFHHPKEDLIFLQLLEREPGLHADVMDLLEEHRSIVFAGHEFNILLGSSRVDSVMLRERLGSAGFAYVRMLREHMSKEQRNLFTFAKVVFTHHDWQAIDRQIDAIEDPLFGAMIADEFQNLFRLIVDRDKSTVFPHNHTSGSTID